MAKPVAVTEQTFDTEVLKSELPVLVDFWAEWCGPCRMVAPVVEELAGEYAGRVKVAKVDVDSNQNLAIRYKVMGIPTLAVFKGGEMIERMVGFMPKPEMKRRLDGALAADPKKSS
ncbi:MAG: thioredoxin [bacterium]|nr:thioredoxin [bacterium]